MCVAGGIGHWSLVAARSATFLQAEREEKAMQDMLGKPVTIPTETRDGVDAAAAARNCAAGCRAANRSTFSPMVVRVFHRRAGQNEITMKAIVRAGQIVTLGVKFQPATR